MPHPLIVRAWPAKTRILSGAFISKHLILVQFSISKFVQNRTNLEIATGAHLGRREIRDQCDASKRPHAGLLLRAAIEEVTQPARHFLGQAQAVIDLAVTVGAG